MTVMSCQIKMNLKSLTKDVGDLNKQIYVSAIENGFQPTGPQCWIYKWDSPDPNADFELVDMVCYKGNRVGLYSDN